MDKNNKKVYADYHGPRCTRIVDGELGHWKFSGTAKKSKVKNRTVNYNGDLILENGLNDVAAMSYPITGIQSQNDPHYIEYQILLAKAAHIDGFFVEWGFKEHRSNKELLGIMEIAKKYDFEIGINWCDAWHFYDWIEEFHTINDRQDKVNLFKESLQYLLDNVFSKKTGVTFNGHPIIFMFGGGPTVEEFKNILSEEYKIPQGLKDPWFFTRAPINGQVTENKVNYELTHTKWLDIMQGVFGWMPTRVRKGEGTKYDNWDRYAVVEDTVDYLDTLNLGQDKYEDSFKIKISSAAPGMDNRACASWDKHDLSHIPRDNGRTYEEMWKYNAVNKSDIDIVYIVSWNDYTERHQIEPTIIDGYRELLTTEKYAADFKGINQNTDGMGLPFKLFDLRKKVDLLNKVGLETICYESILDEIGIMVSKGSYVEAKLEIEGIISLLDNVLQQITIDYLEVNLPNENIISYSDEGGLYLKFKEGIAKRLRDNYYRGYISFEYFDNDNDSFLIKGTTNKEKSDNYSIIADIKKNGTNMWEKGKVQIFKENIIFNHRLNGDYDILFDNNVKVKNITFHFSIYGNSRF
ncbi:hypothetical protein SH1V18_22540 [Vallitalea longa]|uniref:Uncharacterized protein n=1 Tax=Vallitalea longa TaxID=2936439 RepID=A0A9W5YAY5_9FIRM|nr:glycoside hydrolase family 99-like domain-containing protein [Vallitalea longa]GKX29774.1 hypothetical protein SH1V18_22540 [Vallitalea longa]